MTRIHDATSLFILPNFQALKLHELGDEASELSDTSIAAIPSQNPFLLGTKTVNL